MHQILFNLLRQAQTWFRKKCFLTGGVFVQQVVLKIIKHYQEEGQGSEVVQGVLLGLVVEDRLEITNCFPFPQHTEDDVDFDEGEAPAISRAPFSGRLIIDDCARRSEGSFGFRGQRAVRRELLFACVLLL